MTVTESRPDTTAVATEAVEVDHFAAPGLAGTLGTGDHKTLGRMYVLFGLTGGLLSLVLTVLVRLERLNLDNPDDILSFGSANQFFQTWSLARTSLLFFCVLPVLIGLATYIVPLQVGAPSIAFPRAAAAAFWGWLIGILTHVVTVFVDGGLGDIRPSEFGQGNNPEATELSMLSIAMVVVAVLLATICILTTVIAQRPMGMSLLDVPMFSWSMLAAGAIWVLALPVWLANLAVAWVDFRGEGAVRFGRVETLWAQLDWLWGQPMVFAFALPVLGILADIVPTSAGVRQKGAAVIQTAIAVLAVLSFGAFVQPAFAPDVTDQAVFVVMSLLLALPILAVLGGVGDSIRRGKVAFSGHLVLSLIAGLVLLVGALVGVLVAGGAALGIVREIDRSWLADVIAWLDDLDGTVIATGVMDHALLAGLIGGIAGLYYWAPKMFGRRLNSGVGALVGLTLMGGTMLMGGSNVVNGILDESDAVYLSSTQGIWDQDAVELVNVIGLVGSILLVAGVGLLLLDLTVSVLLGKGDATDADDPWNGQTLEWATDSPPPTGNFAMAPVVASAQPLLDSKEGASA